MVTLGCYKGRRYTKTATRFVTFSEWLGKRMEIANLSLRKAAAKAGVSHGTIADLLKGVSPTPETIMKLVKTGTQPESLL